MPCPARYSTIACVMATMWGSLKDAFRLEPAVPGGAEGHPLAGVAKVRRNVVVRIKERSEVNKVLGLGNCARAASHGTSMPDDGAVQHGFAANPVL